MSGTREIPESEELHRTAPFQLLLAEELKALELEPTLASMVTHLQEWLLITETQFGWSELACSTKSRVMDQSLHRAVYILMPAEFVLIHWATFTFLTKAIPYRLQRSH